jgi:DNA ligase D-like protein (predicted ligase)
MSREGETMPELLRPMLPTAGPLPAGPGWAYEFSWAGIRALGCAQPGRMQLFSGSHRCISAAYPEVEAASARRRMLLDGAIVALDWRGRPSVAHLQRRMNRQRPTATLLRRCPVTYYVFDLLRLDDRCVATLPYQRRRELLEELDLPQGPVVRAPFFVDVDGPTMLQIADQYGLAGVIAKRVDSVYQPGRSRSWVQTTVRHTQEVIIGGWLPHPRQGGAIGALLVGVPTEDGLRYVGQVGTGFTEQARRELLEQLVELVQPASPFVEEFPQHAGRTVHWVAPRILGEVAYQHWTPHGRLAHPTWRGLRPGKHVAAVQAPVVVSAPEAEDPRLLAELDRAVAQVRAELRALRGQIAPHFLHNTISTIVAMVSTHPSRARDLLIVFAEFIRYSLRSATETTLAEELANVERYLTLQAARFGDRLRLRRHVAPDALAVVLPFLALQQLVDSAVRHAVEPKQLGATITISAALAGPDCVITVADDGPGVGTAELAECLRAINDQLRERFGPNYGLDVDMVRGGGTTVTMRVPRVVTPARRTPPPPAGCAPPG